MSVVVKRLRSASMEIYVKGAPEVMADICDKDSCGCSRFVEWTRLRGGQFPMTTTIYSRTTRSVDIE